MAEIFKGATDQTAYFALRDSTTGAAKTGIAHTDVTGSYTRNQSSRAAITMANLAAANSAHSDGGWEEVDSTNTPGLYRFDIPDAAFATGADKVVVTVKATGAITEHQMFELTDWNKQVAAIPNAAAAASGGLFTRGTGAGQINQAADGMIDVNLVRLANVQQSLTDLKDFADDGYDPSTNKVQGVVLTDTVTTYTGNTPQTGDNFARLGAPVGASISADVAGVQSDTNDLQTRLPAALVSGRIDANVGALSGDATAADNAESFFDGTGYAGTNNVIPTVSSVTAIATDGISASSIQADAIGASELSATAVTEIAAGVWDQARSSHVAAGSFGQASQIIWDGTAQAGAGSSITLDTGAESVNDFYLNDLVQIIGGTGAGQSRFITAYVGSTRVATVSAAWATAPDNTSVFVIRPFDAIPGATAPSAATVAAAVWDEARSSHTTSGTFGQGAASVQGAVTGAVGSVTGNVGGNVAGSVGSVTGNVGGNVAGSVGSVATGGITAGSIDATAAAEVAGAVWDEPRTSHVAAGSFGQGLQLIRTGTAQAGASTTITLDAGASAINDFYNDNRIEIIAGTGVGQSRFISDYVGTSKVATISAVWSTTPDNTSVFSVEGFGAIPGATAPTAAQVADAVWDEARTDHTTSGTFGQGSASVQGNVTGTVASVTGNVAGNVTGSVGSLATQAKADVALEVSDALRTDTLPELSQGQPAATPTFAAAVMLLYMMARNLGDQDASQQTITNDAGTVIAKAPLTDDGTTLTKEKLVSGP